MFRLTRREILAAAGTMAGASMLPLALAAEPAKTRLILLGTGGGPRPKRDHSATAQVIVAGDALHVVDCGNGVARQIVRAGLSLDRLRHVFITHHHSDHNADYGNLLLLAWASGLRTRVDSWGPPPIASAAPSIGCATCSRSCRRQSASGCGSPTGGRSMRRPTSPMVGDGSGP